jgi:DNA-3-methyladenine glycosylase I
MTLVRCPWAAGDDAVMQAYHDTEWGVPQHEACALFELLSLEGAQAGLSWRTVLRRRDAYRLAYHGFDIARVAAMTDAALERVLADPGVIRHRQKVFSVRENARAALALGDFAGFVWGFAGGAPQRNRWADRSLVPATTPASDALSKALRKAGFRFVGSTICYAFMQASGMVDDHVAACFRAR